MDRLGGLYKMGTEISEQCMESLLTPVIQAR